MFMVSIILTSNDIISIVYHLKLTIFVKKKISYSLWQPPTLNDYLTTYMSGQTEAALSPAVAATGLLKSCCF